jgi:hypothetical protein
VGGGDTGAGDTGAGWLTIGLSFKLKVCLKTAFLKLASSSQTWEFHLQL